MKNLLIVTCIGATLIFEKTACSQTEKKDVTHSKKEATILHKKTSPKKVSKKTEILLLNKIRKSHNSQEIIHILETATSQEILFLSKDCEGHVNFRDQLLPLIIENQTILNKFLSVLRNNSQPTTTTTTSFEATLKKAPLK